MDLPNQFQGYLVGHLAPDFGGPTTSNLNLPPTKQTTAVYWSLRTPGAAILMKFRGAPTKTVGGYCLPMDWTRTSNHEQPPQFISTDSKNVFPGRYLKKLRGCVCSFACG